MQFLIHHWQDIAAVAVVLGALAWTTRYVWRRLLGKSKSACGGCNACIAPRPKKLATIPLPRRSSQKP